MHGTEETENQSNGSAHQAHHHGLAQELHLHISFGGAHGHADSNFPGALGHGYEHDVHNSDAANEKRDGRDAGQQYFHHSRRIAHGIGNLNRVPNIEVVQLAGSDVVAFPQQIGDFLFGFRDHVRRHRGGPDIV